MADKQHAPREERMAFISNPRPALTEAILADLEARGMLDGLDAAGVEESAETFAGPVLVETAQYSERVLAESALWPMGDTGADAEQLQEMLSNSVSHSSSNGDPVRDAIETMFAKDGLPSPNWGAGGSVHL
jgi:hypothetical protein